MRLFVWLWNRALLWIGSGVPVNLTSPVYGIPEYVKRVGQGREEGSTCVAGEEASGGS